MKIIKRSVAANATAAGIVALSLVQNIAVGQISAKHLGTEFPNLGPLTTFKLKLVQSPNKLIR